MLNSFKYWIPLNKLEKSKDSQGNVVMKLGGIASTMRRDTDGEVLDPSGFDVTYLKNSGILNYNHNKSPDAVIGEPTLVEKRKEGLYVECMLYPDSSLAKSVYELGEVLEKNSKTRRLGYSIEGKALERDAFDKSRVTKAMITNLALTMSPKNMDSKVNLIKGMILDADFTESDTIEKSVEDMEKEVVKETQQARNGGTVEYIVNITRPDGTVVTVDKDYNVNVKKALEANGSGAPIKKESLNGELKDLCSISKAEIMEQVLDSPSVISFDKAIQVTENIFNQLQNSNDMANKKITQDVLNKALSDLGFKQDEEELSKAHKGGEDDEMYDDEEEETKPSSTEEDEEDETEEEDEETPPAKKPKKSTEEKEDEPEEESEGSGSEESEEDTEKSVDTSNDLMKSLNDSIQELSNKNSTQSKAIGILIKGIYSELGSVKSELDSSRETIEELKNELSKANEMIEEIGNQPMQRKTTLRAVDRTFEKGIDSDQPQPAKNVLNLKTNRPQILSLLDNMSFEKGFNPDIAKAMTMYESSGLLEKSVIDMIKAEKGLTIL